MFKVKSKLAAALLAIAAVTGNAQAALMTWTFTGIVRLGYPDAGQSVTGALTFDPTTVLGSIDTDGSTFNYQEQRFYPPYPTPPQLVGDAADVTQAAKVGGGTFFDNVLVRVEKNSGYGRDLFAITAMSSFSPGDAYIIIGTEMNTDGVNPSGIFTNTDYTNPDLSIDQIVNWFAAGANSFGAFQAVQGPIVGFDLTSMTVTYVPEPGVSALLCVALCLVCLVVLRKRPAFSRQP